MSTILDIEAGEYHSFCNFCGDDIDSRPEKKFFQAKDGTLVCQDCVKAMSDYFEENTANED